MAATFVVEDGTGKTNSNAYVSDTDADSYFENYTNPTSWTGATTAAKQEALRMATQYLDVVYGLQWRGTRTNTDQALDWPRLGATDYDGIAWDGDEIPQELKDATSEAALRHITETNGLLPDQTTTGDIEEEDVSVGPIRRKIVYAGAKGQFKRFTLVESIIAPLIVMSGTVQRS